MQSLDINQWNNSTIILEYSDKSVNDTKALHQCTSMTNQKMIKEFIEKTAHIKQDSVSKQSNKKTEQAKIQDKQLKEVE